MKTMKAPSLGGETKKLVPFVLAALGSWMCPDLNIQHVRGPTLQHRHTITLDGSGA